MHKYGATRKNIPRYYTLNRLIRYMYLLPCSHVNVVLIFMYEMQWVSNQRFVPCVKRLGLMDASQSSLHVFSAHSSIIIIIIVLRAKWPIGQRKIA